MTSVIEPVTLLFRVVSNDIALEQYEGGFVEVGSAVVLPPGGDFERFGQWRVASGNSCSGGTPTITVLSAFTVDWFDPYDHVGEVLMRVTGNLRYHSAAGFIIRPRHDGDIELGGA